MIADRVHPFDLIPRVLAERLRGFAALQELRCGVACSDIAWERVVGRASAEHVLPAFAAALHELDLARLLDPELAAFLEAVHAACIEQNGELRDELALAVGVLNRVGIEPVLLKGTIRLLDGLYPTMAGACSAISTFWCRTRSSPMPTGRSRRRLCGV
jgi:putative nucleotidyltransferase-like protein